MGILDHLQNRYKNHRHFTEWPPLKTSQKTQPLQKILVFMWLCGWSISKHNPNRDVKKCKMEKNNVHGI
jgi:hypothetical protein